MSRNTRWLLISSLVVIALVLAACGTPAPPPPPPEEAPTPTTPPPPPEPTPTPVPELTGTITVWHGFIETEEQLGTWAATEFEAANPGIYVEGLAVPFDDLQNKYQVEAAAGGGPDIIQGPQDRMTAYAEAGLLAPLDDLAADILDRFVPATVEGSRVNGVLYGIPTSSKLVALFYNTSMISEPPTDSDEMLALAAEHGLAITADWYHNFGFVGAFGGQLFDEDYRCILDQGGTDEALAFLATVCASEGVVCDPNDGDMDTLFRQGQVGMRIQGPWASGDFQADLGLENVAVAPIPAIAATGNSPTPFMGVDVLSINVNSSPEQQQLAMMFLDFVTSGEVQKAFVDQANWIPANAAVDTSGNPLIGGFLAQASAGAFPFPNVAEFGATWGPGGDAVTKVLEDVSSPEEAVAEMTALINEANQK